jgi:hypothetical protein
VTITRPYGIVTVLLPGLIERRRRRYLYDVGGPVTADEVWEFYATGLLDQARNEGEF